MKSPEATRSDISPLSSGERLVVGDEAESVIAEILANGSGNHKHGSDELLRLFITPEEFYRVLGRLGMIVLTCIDEGGGLVVTVDTDGNRGEKHGFVIGPPYSTHAYFEGVNGNRSRKFLNLGSDLKSEHVARREFTPVWREGLETEVMVVDTTGRLVATAYEELAASDSGLAFMPEKDGFMLEFCGDPHSDPIHSVSSLAARYFEMEEYIARYGWRLLPASTALHEVGTQYTAPHAYVRKIVDYTTSINPDYMHHFDVLTTQANKDVPSPEVGRAVLNYSRVIFSTLSGLAMAAPAGKGYAGGRYTYRPAHQALAFGGSSTFTSPLPESQSDALARQHELLGSNLVPHPARIGDPSHIRANHLPRMKEGIGAIEEGQDTFGGHFELMLAFRFLDRNIHTQLVRVMESGSQRELEEVLPRLVSGDMNRMFQVAHGVIEAVSKYKYDGVVTAVDGDVVRASDLFSDILEFVETMPFLQQDERKTFAVPEGAKEIIRRAILKPDLEEIYRITTLASNVDVDLPSAAGAYIPDAMGIPADYVRARMERFVELATQNLLDQTSRENLTPTELNTIHEQAIIDAARDWSEASFAYHREIFAEGFEEDGTFTRFNNLIGRR